jgi:hypothetical protein
MKLMYVRYDTQYIMRLRKSACATVKSTRTQYYENAGRFTVFPFPILRNDILLHTLYFFITTLK